MTEVSIFDLKEGCCYKKAGFRNQHSEKLFRRKWNKLYVYSQGQWALCNKTRTKDSYYFVGKECLK